MKKIKKAVIPVAGLGTRFLPATKAQPKEMLAVVDKPVIQYIIEEAVASGIEEVILITGQSKRSIEDHFDRNFELEHRLEAKGKLELLEEVKKISSLVKLTYVRQPEPLGDGHAVLQAHNLINRGEYFAVMFGDDIIDAKIPALKQMIQAYEKTKGSIIAVEEVPREKISKYGVIGGKQVGRRLTKIDQLVEKPKPEEAPSNLAIVGKYIVPAKIFGCIKKAEKSFDGELRLIDGLKILLKTNPIYAYEFLGTRYDTGNKLEYLKATVNFGLKHRELNGEFREYLKGLKLR